MQGAEPELRVEELSDHGNDVVRCVQAEVFESKRIRSSAGRRARAHFVPGKGVNVVSVSNLIQIVIYYFIKTLNKASKELLTSASDFLFLLGLWRIDVSECALDSSFLLKRIDEFAVLVHLKQDVAAADELSADEDLRDCRPAGEVLDALSYVVARENIVGIVLDSVHAEDLNNGV